MPILIDGLAHTFWKSIHIAVVHRVNGKEHVHYELRKAACESDKANAGQKHGTSVEDDPYSIPPLLISMRLGLLHRSDCVKKTAYYLRTHCDADLSLESPPPKGVA